MVSRYMNNPDNDHWKAVKWIQRYIKGIIDVGLVFEKDTNGKQECMRYVDSDYARDLDKRRPMTRYVLHCPKHQWVGARLYSLLLLFWQYGHDRGYKGGHLASRLLDDLRIEHDQLKINCDSMIAIYLVKNQVYYVRMKHIDVKFHFIIEILEKDDLVLEKIHMKSSWYAYQSSFKS